MSECTTIVVGGELTGDGSRIYARSEDFDAMRCKNWLVFDETETDPKSLLPTTVPSSVHCLRNV